MPPGPVVAGPVWLWPPDRMPRVQPEKKIIAATNTTPATIPSDAAARLSPLGRCPCGDFGARPPTTRHILCLNPGPGLPPWPHHLADTRSVDRLADRSRS